MKEEQKYSQQHSSYSQEILLTPTHMKIQNQAYKIQSFEYYNTRKRLEDSMSQYKQNKETNQNKKLQFLNLLLKTLGYSKSAKVLQKEAMDEHYCRNPEKSSSKKSKKQAKQQSLNQKIEQIINQSSCFQKMLNQLSQTLKQEQQQKLIQEIVDQSQNINPFNNRQLQRAIQNMFPKTQTTTIPVYQSLEVDCSGKVIQFADLNLQQDLCILDNQNTLYVLQQKNRQKILQTSLSQKLQIIDMKWVNSQIMVLLSSNNKILFYDKKIENIMIMRSVKIPIITHEISVIRNGSNSQHLYVLTASKYLFVPFKINVNGREVIEENLPTFEIDHQITALTTIKVTHRVTFHRPLNSINEQTEFNIITETEQFYGLSNNMRKIIKFDTIVEQSGIIWQCSTHQFVTQLKTSDCGRFLQMLLINSQNSTLQNFNVKKVSFIKMSGSGCIQQRLDMSLQQIYKDISVRSRFIYGKSGHSRNRTRWFKLSPYWVRCFGINNFIYYVSLKTGNLLFGQQIQKNEIKLLTVGNQNTLLYESNGKLIIISTQDHGKKTVTLQSRRNPDLRESLIQRFSRIHGIPENLLFLLRTIRNNDMELEEISE